MPAFRDVNRARLGARRRSKRRQSGRLTSRHSRNTLEFPQPRWIIPRPMAKAYWISAYRAIFDQEALAAYAKLAGPALQAGGGRFLARGVPAQVYESGQSQRTVLIEFDSVAQAIAAHDSPAYQEALRVLGSAVDRDLRII